MVELVGNIPDDVVLQARLDILYGQTPDITIKAHELPEESEPTVEKSGTLAEPVFDIGIPQAMGAVAAREYAKQAEAARDAAILAGENAKEELNGIVASADAALDQKITETGTALDEKVATATQRASEAASSAAAAAQKATAAEQAMQGAQAAQVQAEQSAQDAADSAAMSKDWAAGQPVTYNGTPVSIAYAGAQRIASITAYGETPQGGTTEAPVALTGVDSVQVCGNNLLPMATETKTIYGVTFTPNSNGSITVSGTATGGIAIYNFADGLDRAMLDQTVFVSGAIQLVKVIINEKTAEGAFARNVIVDRGQGASGILTKQKDSNILYATLQVQNGDTVNHTIYPMLNLGSTAMPYEPYQGSVTTLPIPRPLRRVGDVRDVWQSKLKSVWDKKIIFDGSADEEWLQLGTNLPNKYRYALPLPLGVRADTSNNNAGSNNFPLLAQGQTGDGARGFTIAPYSGEISIIVYSDGGTLESFRSYLAANPMSVWYQSTNYDGTNGLDVCLTEYQTGFVELDGTEGVNLGNIDASADVQQFNIYGVLSSPNNSENAICSHFERANVSGGVDSGFQIYNTLLVFGMPRDILLEYGFITGDSDTYVPAFKAYLAAQNTSGTPVQVAYQLASPETYATDPVDFDNAAGPLTVMTGGEVEVRMTELLGTRSPELTGKMDKAVYAQVGNPSELDNDNFLHCVNQRNVSGTISTSGYFIDRWKLISGTVQITENGLVLNGTISQILENAAGTDVTASSSAGAASYDNSTKTFTLTATGQTITWAKLEKGSVATPYVPKGYGAELVECYRYFWISSMPVNIFKTTAGDYFRNTVYFPIAMRTVPSVTILSSNGTVSINAVTIDAVKFAGNGGNDTVTSFSASADL